MKANKAKIYLRPVDGYWLATSRHPILRLMFVFETTEQDALRAMNEQCAWLFKQQGYRLRHIEKGAAAVEATYES